MDWLGSHDKEIVALGTITLAAFTVVLAFATTFLYLATKNLVEGADRNAAKQLRAYVFIAGGQVILDEANGRISTSSSLKNFGQTPGYEFKTWTGIRIARSDEGTFGEPGHWKQESIIGPSAEFQTPSDLLSITKGQIDEISARRQSVFVSGRASYVDAFGNSWTFSFFDAAAGPIRSLGAGQLGWALSPRGYTETN